MPRSRRLRHLMPPLRLDHATCYHAPGARIVRRALGPVAGRLQTALALIKTKGGEMNNGKLTRDETIALLRKLSSDDAFRTMFEKDSAAALKQIGVSSSELAALPPSAITTEPLPAKEQFQQALNEVLEAGVSDHLCQVWPMLKLTYGDAGGAKLS